MKENGHRRVVVTGLGLVTPVGNTVEDAWSAILAGKSGFGPITLFDTEGQLAHGACEVKEFDPEPLLGRKEARRRDRNAQFVAVALDQAMKDSGLKVTDSNRERIGVIMGTGIGGIRTLVEQEHVLLNSGPRRVSPFAVPMIMPNSACGMAAIDYGLQGPSYTITTACAAGCDGVGQAFRNIKYGIVDAAVTGGVESPLVGVSIGSFTRAGVVSMKADGTPSPFDKDRDGLIPGEGAGMLILEELEFAKARGARIYAEIVGYGQTNDAHHITAPAEGGAGAAMAIQRALAEAGVQPEEVDYINAHGTGTMLNDASETAAIKSVFGEHAYDIPISSTKSMTGHVMGGTGAIESVFCSLILRDQKIPPTINFNEPDEGCDLDYVPNESRSANVKTVTNNAFGFGGHNAVLVFKEYAE